MRHILAAAIAWVAAACFLAPPVMADSLLDQLFDETIRPGLPASAASNQLSSPYAFEFTGEDALRLTVHNSKSGVVVGVHYRMHTPENHAFATREFFTPASDRTASSGEFAIGRGYLQNVTVFATSGAPLRGQTFVRLQVIRGRGAAAVVLGTIVQGYVTGNQDRAWPGSLLEGSLEGDGYFRVFAGTDPAAGGNPSETVPTGARWSLVSVRCFLLTNATVVTRRPILTIGNGSLDYAAVALPNTVGASTGLFSCWSQGLPLETAIAGSQGVAGLPTNLQMLGGHNFLINATNQDPGDNWSAPSVAVREWLEAQ